MIQFPSFKPFHCHAIGGILKFLQYNQLLNLTRDKRYLISNLNGNGHPCNDAKLIAITCPSLNGWDKSCLCLSNIPVLSANSYKSETSCDWISVLKKKKYLMKGQQTTDTYIENDLFQMFQNHYLYLSRNLSAWYHRSSVMVTPDSASLLILSDVVSETIQMFYF